jgi:hypothetical protein
MALRGTNEHFGLDLLLKLRKKYGNWATFLVGNKAFVIVYGLKLAKDIFIWNAFSDLEYFLVDKSNNRTSAVAI